LSNESAVTNHELESEHAELLPSRETLWVGHCQHSFGAGQSFFGPSQSLTQVGYGNTVQSGLINISAANGSLDNILSLGSGGIL
jgi:hypothetical protein